jgi:hypothetical protein
MFSLPSPPELYLVLLSVAPLIDHVCRQDKSSSPHLATSGVQHFPRSHVAPGIVSRSKAGRQVVEVEVQLQGEDIVGSHQRTHETDGKRDDFKHLGHAEKI